MPTGSVQLVGSLQQALAASDVTRVAVTVTAPDMSPLTAELVKTGGQWSGTLGRVPAGADRTFSAEAFGADGTTLFTGSATGIPITPGRTALVAHHPAGDGGPASFRERGAHHRRAGGLGPLRLPGRECHPARHGA